MTEAQQIVNAILEVEEEGEENLQDLLGQDYAMAEPVPQGEPASVEVHDRWKDVIIGDTRFCISYLTPVAASLPGVGVVLTDKQWSSSTSNHIRKWYNEVFTPSKPYTYQDIKSTCETMPQAELIELFKKKSKRALWTKRQAAAIERLPQIQRPLKGGAEHRVSVQPHEPE